jgi:hypothetical protein
VDETIIAVCLRTLDSYESLVVAPVESL